MLDMAIHDVWINPLNPENFIIGDDGGGEVTFNGGETFRIRHAYRRFIMYQ
jgi:hypothetical protein